MGLLLIKVLLGVVGVSFGVGGLPLTLYYGEGGGSSPQRPPPQHTFQFPLPPQDFLFRRVPATRPPSPRGSYREESFPLSITIPIYGSSNSSVAPRRKEETPSEGFSWASLFLHLLHMEEDGLGWPSALDFLQQPEKEASEEEEPAESSTFLQEELLHRNETEEGNSLVAPTSSSQLPPGEDDALPLLPQEPPLEERREELKDEGVAVETAAGDAGDQADGTDDETTTRSSLNEGIP